MKGRVPTTMVVVVTLMLVTLASAGSPSTAHGQPTAPGVAPLSTALDREMQVNKALTDPTLDKNLAAIRAALQQGTPLVQEIMTNLQNNHAGKVRTRYQDRRF